MNQNQHQRNTQNYDDIQRRTKQEWKGKERRRSEEENKKQQHKSGNGRHLQHGGEKGGVQKAPALILSTKITKNKNGRGSKMWPSHCGPCCSGMRSHR